MESEDKTLLGHPEELKESVARFTSCMAVEEMIIEMQVEKDGLRRSGRDTRHTIIENESSGKNGFALHLGGCDAQLPADCTHVLTLWDDDQDPPALRLSEGSHPPMRTVFRIRDSHDADIRQYFGESCALLAECCTTPGGVAYVHCQMGRSRSATVIIAFLMRHFGMSLLAAYGHVATRRHVSALNYGFWAQLCDEEMELMAPAAAAYPSFPLAQYFCLLERAGSPFQQIRALDRAMVVAEWRRQRGLDSAERRAGPFFGRLVHNLRFVCADLAATSKHCATTLRIMDGAPQEEAERSTLVWGDVWGDGDV